MKKLIALGAAAFLAGCAHAPMPSVSHPVPHHIVKKPIVKAPPVVVPPVVTPATPPLVEAPAPVKKSFKERWESKFFRDRATAK